MIDYCNSLRTIVFMKNILSKVYNHVHLFKRAIIISICIFVALLYLHGEIYTHFESVYPNEIMDIQFSIFPFSWENNQAICSENCDDKHFIYFDDIQMPYIYNVCLLRPSFFLEWLPLQDLKKRLSILQRYNSWNSISGLFHLFISTMVADFLHFVYEQKI